MSVVRRTKEQINRDKFDGLRVRYVAAMTRLDEAERAIRLKYNLGDEWRRWINPSETLRLETLRKRLDAAADRFLAHVDSISPRDWRGGVPAHWVYTKLTYEDAVRPRTEKLSVVPPLSYGARSPLT